MGTQSLQPLCLAAILVFLAGGCASPGASPLAGRPPANAPEVSLCDVSLDGEAYHGKGAVIRGTFATNLGEYSELYSSDCPGVVAEVSMSRAGGRSGGALNAFRKRLLDACDIPIKAYCPMEFRLTARVRLRPSDAEGYAFAVELLEVYDAQRVVPAGEAASGGRHQVRVERK